MALSYHTSLEVIILFNTYLDRYILITKNLPQSYLSWNMNPLRVARCIGLYGTKNQHTFDN
jgi:hypothetical protein